jgi:hypothetical protein
MGVNRLSHLYAVSQPLNRNFFSQPAISRVTTVELRDPSVLNYYIENGFVYIRRLHYNYNHILRYPTNGCYVELTKMEDLGSMPINSPSARRLIGRLSYF